MTKHQKHGAAPSRYQTKPQRYIHVSVFRVKVTGNVLPENDPADPEKQKRTKLQMLFFGILLKRNHTIGISHASAL
ncbi:MAG: hypothetical protein IPK61_08195 [Saprospiraceae bacterium]|nr:hypothetical protein [Saprospiraceae bacterium]